MSLRTNTPAPGSRRSAARRSPALGLALAIAAGALLLFPGSAMAASGGVSTVRTPASVPGKRAKLVDGLAIPPANAPRKIVAVINAANRIAKGHSYCYGGGHQRFRSRCYDCSGAASFALRGGRLIDSPMPSSGYFRWGRRGKGKWLTVYTNSGHMYIVVAGLRFDTSMTAGEGPGWSRKLRTDNGRFRARHWPGL